MQQNKALQTANNHQSDYWDKVAGQISKSNNPNKDLVGYHSPYDAYVRKLAERLLEHYASQIADKECIAELGSGAGLNLRYFSKFNPRKLLAFDCSLQLLTLAKANLADLNNVEYIHTSSNNLPLPKDEKISLLFTLTVLQHITKPEMLNSIVSDINSAKPNHILIIEDTHAIGKTVTDNYILRSPLQYESAFGNESYKLIGRSFVSLTWAARLFGVINKLFGLYNHHEGAQIPKSVFALSSFLSPIARTLDVVLPGKFGMSAMLFTKI